MDAQVPLRSTNEKRYLISATVEYLNLSFYNDPMLTVRVLYNEAQIRLKSKGLNINLKASSTDPVHIHMVEGCSFVYDGETFTPIGEGEFVLYGYITRVNYREAIMEVFSVT